jgi:hypothetical protein
MQTISEPRSIYGNPQQIAGCIRSKKTNTPKRTRIPAAPDFLRHRFLPRYCSDGNEQTYKEQIEESYFESLRLLAETYRLDTVNVSNLPFPVNVLLSQWDTMRQIRKVAPQADLHMDRSYQFIIASNEVCPTKNGLFYVAVQPLYLLTKQQDLQSKKAARLLLSVFSYLYRIAGMPYYTWGGSFINEQYDLMKEWYEESDDGVDEYKDYMEGLEAAKDYGHIMEKKIKNSCHLQYFEKRLAAFRPKDEWQTSCHVLAQKFYDLWVEYPDSHIFRHIIPLEGEDSYYDVIHAEQYISFVATNEGAVCISLIEMVNNFFNECSDIEQPSAMTIFRKDGQVCAETVDYDCRFFDLMHDLCDVLNELP